MVYIEGFTDAFFFKNTGKKNNCFERVFKITFQRQVYITSLLFG